jgi:hypothetical protein
MKPKKGVVKAERKRRKRRKRRRMKSIRRGRKVKKMKMMMNKLVLAVFFFVYKAFTPAMYTIHPFKRKT